MKHLLLGLFAAALFCGFGCTTVRECPPEQAQENPDDREQALCRKLLVCFLENDNSGFRDLLTPETRETFDPDQLRKTRAALASTLGEPISFQFVTKLEFVALTPYIWKIRFRKTDGEGRVFHREALFRILAGKTADGQPMILGFNFL